jgi:hypothetical protein
MSDDITVRLRRDCMSLIADEAADTIDRLRAERDGARSMVIVDDWCKDPTAKHADLWAARGWEYLKEDGK